MVKEIISNLNNFMWGYPFIILLTITSIYLSIKLKFPQLKIILAFKDLFKSQDDFNRNKITSFKSLMTVLAGTLGTGNITGVALAISIGGIGSIFWLLISGMLAMVISYAENLIVLKYRKKDRNKGYYGGTMYVLEEVLGQRKLAVFFAIVVIVSAICTGTMTQSNALSTLINASVGISKNVIGIILSLITAYIVFGGKKRIAKLSSIIIPICTLMYICLCLSILYINRFNIVCNFKDILQCAFGLKPAIGGIVGTSLSSIIGRGFAIGMFSNEAGMGSAPMFMATVDEENIEVQSRIAATSVVVDTIILCMLTGITIISTGMYNIPNTADMLNSVFGIVPFGNVVLNICMVFFVIATIPCWEYYGEQAIKYLFKTNLYVYIFRTIYVIGIYLGSIIIVEIVWDLSGISNALMTLPNLYMIYKSMDMVKDIYNTKKIC